MVSKDFLSERFEANAMGFVNAYVQVIRISLSIDRMMRIAGLQN
jgi:hypothetical protein